MQDNDYEAALAYSQFVSQLRTRYGLDITDIGRVEITRRSDVNELLEGLEEKYNLNRIDQ